MFGKNSFNDNVRTSLTHMIEDGITSRGSGAAKFTRSDKKTVGYIYFHDGAVYAASMSNYMPNFLTRLVQSGFIDDKQLMRITRYFGEENLSDPKIPDFVADSFMVETNVLTNIKQDFFLEIFETILGWDNVNAEWRANEITNFYKINPVDPTRIITLVDNRNKFLETVADSFGVDVPQVKSLTFRAKNPTDFDDETPLVFTQIMSSANGEWTVNDASQRFGLTLFVTVQALYELWKADFITVIYDSEYPVAAYINPTPVETVVETSAPEVTVPAPEVATATNEATVMETVEEDETVEEVSVPIFDEEETVEETEVVEVPIFEETETVEVYENDFIDNDAEEETEETVEETVEETLTVEDEETEEDETVEETEHLIVASPIDTLIAQLTNEVNARKQKIAELTNEAADILNQQEQIAEQVHALQATYKELNEKATTISNEIENLTAETDAIVNKTKFIN